MTTPWGSDTGTSRATGPAEHPAGDEDSAQDHPGGPDGHRVGQDPEQHDAAEQERREHAARGEDAVDHVVGGARGGFDGAVAYGDDRLLDGVGRLTGPLAHRS